MHPAPRRRRASRPAFSHALLSLLLMLMLVARPPLVLACAVHADSHATAQMEPCLQAGPHLAEAQPSDLSGFPSELDGVLHLGFCCGHFHVPAAQALELFASSPPAPEQPPQLWPARLAAWSAPPLFRPPIRHS